MLFRSLRHATGEALRHLRGLRARKVAIVCHDAAWEGLSGGTIGEAIAEGALLGLYRFDTYKGKEAHAGIREIEALTLLCADRGAIRALKGGID